jgi:hypothetical protein
MIKNPETSIWHYALKDNITGTYSFKLIVESNEHTKPVETYDSQWGQKVRDSAGNTICIFILP